MCHGNGKEAAEESSLDNLRDIYHFHDVADEAYRTFRTLLLKDPATNLDAIPVEWIPSSPN
jgi:hypothetical protein